MIKPDNKAPIVGTIWDSVLPFSCHFLIVISWLMLDISMIVLCCGYY